jgi:hypothetical protein
MLKQKYIGAKTSVLKYRVILFALLLFLIINSFYFFLSDSKFSILPFSIMGIMVFLTKISSITYDEKHIYIVNYKGKKSYLRSVDFNIQPIVFFLDFYWIKFPTTNEKYLFSPQVGQIFGTTDSDSIAKEIEKMIKK